MSELTPICADSVTPDVLSFVSAAFRSDETAEWSFQIRTVNFLNGERKTEVMLLENMNIFVSFDKKNPSSLSWN